MDEGVLTINDKKYVVGHGGMLVDLDGNLCGYLGSDLVKQCGVTDRGDNLVDLLSEAMSETPQVRASGIR